MTTVKFEFTKEQAEDLNQVHAEFHHAYGVAMSQWAGVERSLYLWFVHVTQMKEKVARAVFYSARSFNARAEMLQAAIDQGGHLAPERLEFIQKALGRAWGYSSFRNRMAHGEPMMNILDLKGQPRKVSWSIVQGKTRDRATDISMEDFETAHRNFYMLQNLLIDTHPTPGVGNPDHQWPAKALQLLSELPTEANSKTVPNPKAPSSQPQADGRVNKKAYREQQQAAKDRPD
ncbi:hypothetical protein [Bradyrhizobium sp. URHD0069]|uniref:hypothetical protein n=1 Tax=Bradyrhizobium sp. URHD0069 TaxID=1380355 RepID=UPI000495C92C|nr:hypothetical protein [Bradyrhizobium sp. URHD0069]